MRAGPGSVGVAAPQIGDMRRVAVVDTAGHRKFGAESQGFFVLVNPQIIERAGERLGREGCMSLPDFTANVKRFENVTVRFQDLSGVWQKRGWLYMFTIWGRMSLTFSLVLFPLMSATIFYDPCIDIANPAFFGS